MNRTICVTNVSASAARLFLQMVILSLMTFAALFATSIHAQHSSHTYRYTGDVQIEHIPEHDQVLPSPPDSLVLRFTDHVSLVKLVVKNAEEKVIDVQFRYNPVPDRVFIWPLPELPASPWYSVDWGVVDRSRKLMSGKFMFAAGPDAKKPSELIPENNDEHMMVPDYRLLDLQDYQPLNP